MKIGSLSPDQASSLGLMSGSLSPDEAGTLRFNLGSSAPDQACNLGLRLGSQTSTVSFKLASEASDSGSRDVKQGNFRSDEVSNQRFNLGNSFC